MNRKEEINTVDDFGHYFDARIRFADQLLSQAVQYLASDGIERHKQNCYAQAR